MPPPRKSMRRITLSARRKDTSSSDGAADISDSCEEPPAAAAPKRAVAAAPRMKCFRCGRAGHLASHCDSRRAAAGRPFPVCLKCGRSGHTSALCGREGAPVMARPAANQGVYVLAMTAAGGDTRYYVGKSLDIARRLQEHTRGESSCDIRPGDAVQRVPPTTAGSVVDMEAWERGETLHRMRAHGVSRVRGWRFTARGDLPQHLHEAAFAEVCERFDLCRRCGQAGHFAAECGAHTRAAWAD